MPDGTLVHGYVSKLPLASQTFYAVLALDALEHVDNAKAFAEAFRVLKPEGLAMSTVLAYALLLSYRYRAAGHLRRQSSGPNDSPLAPKQLLAYVATKMAPLSKVGSCQIYAWADDLTLLH